MERRRIYWPAREAGDARKWLLKTVVQARKGNFRAIQGYCEIIWVEVLLTVKDSRLQKGILSGKS